MREAWIALDRGAVVSEYDADLIVPWWSFTKTVLAGLALILVEKGRLSLDQPLSGRSFTLRQLLQHRAGLANYGELTAYHESVARNDEPWPVEDLLRRVDAARLRFEPGQGWAYSNIGYWHVRGLIELTSDQTLDCALQKYLLAPLSIPDVQVATTREHLSSVEMGEAGGYHPGWVYHGLLIGPLRAAAQLLYKLIRGAIVKTDSQSAMLDAYPLGGPIHGRDWEKPGYGLGLMIGQTRSGIDICGHTGGGPGSTVAVYHRPATGSTVAVFSTSWDENTSENKALSLLG